MFFRISLIAIAALLGACSEPPRDATPTVAVPPAAATTAATPEANATPVSSVVFRATPATIRRCDATDGNATVSLNWDVRPSSIGFVTILVGDRTFAEGTSSGTSTTGNWVRDDTVFSLIDAASKKPLATLKVPFVEC